MTSYGRNEQTAFGFLLSKAPDKPISIVMDAYDLFAAIDTLGTYFLHEILARPETAPVVITMWNYLPYSPNNRAQASETQIRKRCTHMHIHRDFTTVH